MPVGVLVLTAGPGEESDSAASMSPFLYRSPSSTEPAAQPPGLFAFGQAGQRARGCGQAGGIQARAPSAGAGEEHRAW
jgi:hypothetical protein